VGIFAPGVTRCLADFRKTLLLTSNLFFRWIGTTVAFRTFPKQIQNAKSFRSHLTYGNEHLKGLKMSTTSNHRQAQSANQARRNDLHDQINQLSAVIKQESKPFNALVEGVGNVVVGQEKLIHRMLIGLLANGHLLIEGVPGLAKTTAVACLAQGINTGFQRLQFTPDLLPADLIGTMVYRPQTQEFVVQKGPIFSNLILADEINRAPAKVQSALLEAMQERQVTIGSETFRLDSPFLVMATQNPVEQEGTYPLPEAQMDRFLLKVVVDYPNREQEKMILERMSKTEQSHSVETAMQPEDIHRARKLVDKIYVDNKVKDYIVDLVMATRDPAAYGIPVAEWIEYGVSPRATIGLTLAAKANAFLSGRGFVIPQAEEKTSDDVVQAIVEEIRVP
jgi:MoxR-like ATPase